MRLTGKGRSFATIGQPPPCGAQNAGIQRQNQYVAARNRFAGLKDAHVLIGPGPEHQEKQL